MVAYLEKTKENVDFHQILDFLTSSSINFALIKQIHANVDGNAVVVSESSVRRDLHLNDEDGTACLTTNEIFENLALMGYEPASDKLTFYKGRVTQLFQNMLVPPVVVGEGSEKPPEPQPTPSTAPPEVLSQVTIIAASQPPKDPNTYKRTKRGSGPWRQETMRGMQAQTRSEGVSNLFSDPSLSGGHILGSGEDSMEHQIELTDNVPNTPHDSPLLGVNTPRSDEGSLELNELMDLRRVTKLEQRQRSRILKNYPFRFGSSRRWSLGKKDASKQGRKHLKTQLQFGEEAFDDIDDLVDEGMAFVQEKDAENQEKIGADDTEVVKRSGDTEVLDTEKAVNTAGEGVSTASVTETVSTTAPRTPPTTTTVFDDEDVTIAMAQTLIKMKEEKAKEKGDVIKNVEDSSRPVRSITTLQPLPTIDPKDKELELKNSEVRKRKDQEEGSKVAIAEMFDEVQTRMDADYELAARMTQEEQEKYTIKEMARITKPPTKITGLRKSYDDYVKNMGGYKHSQLKGKSYEEIQGLYERQQKRIQDFTPMDSEKEAQKPVDHYEPLSKNFPIAELVISVAWEKKDESKDMLVQERFQYHPLEGHDLLLWGDLRMIFDPDEKDKLWINQLDWKLYENYRVHTLFMDGKPMEINMLVEKKYPLIKELLEKMLNL
ncbi:hypothetical protein Tco_0481437 [Tanacetum coccineum]